MRGWETVTNADVERMRHRHAAAPPTPKRSKYRNVKTLVGSERFDSKREADQWIELRQRERNGEITNLRRQVPYTLYAAQRDETGTLTGVALSVCEYLADFDFYENGAHVVQDAKGIKTKEYLLKRKFLELQEGIVIREM
jgi:hypothetical protein